MIAELVLSILIQTNVHTNTQFNTIKPNRIIVGDSLNTRMLRDSLLQAEKEVQRDRRQVASRSQTSARESSQGYGESYTGQGTAKKLYPDHTNNCAKWAKNQTPWIHTRIYYAGSQPVQSKTPKVGAIAMEWNHFSLVEEVRANSIVVHESNYIKGWITEREIPLNKIRGYVIY